MAKFLGSSGVQYLWTKAKETFYENGNDITLKNGKKISVLAGDGTSTSNETVITSDGVIVGAVKNDMSDPYIGYKNAMDKDGLHIYGVDSGGNQDTNERVDITSSGVKYSGAQGNGRTLKLGFEEAGFPQLIMDGNPGESKSVKIDFDDVIVQNESTTHKLSNKVDKVEGKGLIDENVANNISYASNSGFKLGNRWSFNVADMTHTSPAGGAKDLKFAIDSGLTLTTAADSGDFDITLVKGSKTHKLSEKLSTIRIADGENAGSLKIGRTSYLSTEGPYSIAIGLNGHTGPDGMGAVAINGGEALGAGSVAISGCTAKGDGQIAFGKLNITDTDNKYACIIGNGHVDSKGNKVYSNAYTIDWNGNAWFAGDVESATAGKLSEKYTKTPWIVIEDNSIRCDADDAYKLSPDGLEIGCQAGNYPPRVQDVIVNRNVEQSDGSYKVETHKLTAKADKTYVDSLKPVTFTVSVPTTGWSTLTDSNGETYYKLTITASNAISTGYPVCDVVLPDDIAAARLQENAYKCINKVSVGSGNVTLYCFEEIPSVAFTIRIQIARS